MLENLVKGFLALAVVVPEGGEEGYEGSAGEEREDGDGDGAEADGDALAARGAGAADVDWLPAGDFLDGDLVGGGDEASEGEGKGVGGDAEKALVGGNS